MELTPHTRVQGVCPSLLALTPDGVMECSHGCSAAEPVVRFGGKTCPGAGRGSVREACPTLRFLCPIRGRSRYLLLPTGCAALHPWLQPAAPSGAIENAVAKIDG